MVVESPRRSRSRSRSPAPCFIFRCSHDEGLGCTERSKFCVNHKADFERMKRLMPWDMKQDVVPFITNNQVLLSICMVNMPQKSESPNARRMSTFDVQQWFRLCWEEYLESTNFSRPMLLGWLDTPSARRFTAAIGWQRPNDDHVAHRDVD